jgi:hypothetical protein
MFIERADYNEFCVKNPKQTKLFYQPLNELTSNILKKQFPSMDECSLYKKAISKNTNRVAIPRNIFAIVEIIGFCALASNLLTRYWYAQKNISLKLIESELPKVLDNLSENEVEKLESLSKIIEPIIIYLRSTK